MFGIKLRELDALILTDPTLPHHSDHDLIKARSSRYIQEIQKGNDRDSIGVVLDAFIRLYYRRMAALEPNNPDYRQSGDQEDSLDWFKFPKDAPTRFTSDDHDKEWKAYKFLVDAFGTDGFGRNRFIRVAASYAESVSTNPSLRRKSHE